MPSASHVPTPQQPGRRSDPALAAFDRLVAVRGPTQPVSARAGAVRDPESVRLTSDAAVKHNTSAGRPGYPSATTHWQTHLHVEAWVRNTSFTKHVWADAHVFAHDGALVQHGTFALAYARPAGDGGDLFQLDLAVYEGTTATPGSAEPRPDVRSVQYRLYYQYDDRVLTDGILHDCQLRSDSVSR
jgi:hypothetical protein